MSAKGADVSPPALARQAAELAALIVDALDTYVGRDIRAVAPTLLGDVLITDHRGRAWLLRLVPEADGSDSPEGGAS